MELTDGSLHLSNFLAITVGMLAQVGMLGGAVSLIGGHGTAIAWAPRISEEYNIANAMEIGIACATFRLIFASSMGGPIAKFLIKKHDLKPTKDEPIDVGISSKEEQTRKASIGYLEFLDAILARLIWRLLSSRSSAPFLSTL